MINPNSPTVRRADQRRKQRPPDSSHIVIVDRATGKMIRKGIHKNSRLANLVTQFYARQKDYFVYRINVYLKGGLR